MMMFALVIGLLGAADAAAVAPAPTAVAPAPKPKVEMVDKVPKVYGVIVPDGNLATAKDPIVCRILRNHGSRINSKTCMLKSQWSQIERDAQQATMQHQHDSYGTNAH